MGRALQGPCAPRLIAVGGGKGGVGKSVVAANLAVAITQAGCRAVLVDVDLGAANQHTLFGLDRLGPGLQAFLAREIDTLEAAVQPTGVRNLSIVGGVGALPGAANIVHARKQRLLRHIRVLETDAVILDVGAGTSFNVLDFFGLADLRLVVLTSQLPSVQNAYAFLKGGVMRAIRRLADTPEKRAVLDSAVAVRETSRVQNLRREAESVDPAFARAIATVTSRYGARMVGNQVFDPKEVGVFHAFSRMIHDFLDLSVPVLGHLRSSRRIHESVTRRRPFLLDPVEDDESRTMRSLAEALLLEPVDSEGAETDLAEEARAPAEPTSPRVLGEEGEEALPSALGPYSRRHPRWPVDWTARLECGAGAVRVRVLQVSLGGAGLETTEALSVGEQGTLFFDSLPGRPTLSVVVRVSVPETRRAGVAFLVEGDMPARIVDLARESGAPGEASVPRESADLRLVDA